MALSSGEIAYNLANASALSLNRNLFSLLFRASAVEKEQKLFVRKEQKLFVTTSNYLGPI